MENSFEFRPTQFSYKGKNYETIIPEIDVKGRTIMLNDAIEDEALLDMLMERAWKNRDEESFIRNGMFRLIFTMEDETNGNDKVDHSGTHIDTGLSTSTIDNPDLIGNDAMNENENTNSVISNQNLTNAVTSKSSDNEK